MPRNVVTVVRRRTLLPRGASRRLRQDVVIELMARRYRLRPRDDGDGVEIDFPKAIRRREAKERVLRDPDALEPGWRRLFVVYPSESALRDHER